LHVIFVFQPTFTQILLTQTFSVKPYLHCYKSLKKVVPAYPSHCQTDLRHFFARVRARCRYSLLSLLQISRNLSGSGL